MLEMGSSEEKAATGRLVVTHKPGHPDATILVGSLSLTRLYVFTDLTILYGKRIPQKQTMKNGVSTSTVSGLRFDFNVLASQQRQ